MQSEKIGLKTENGQVVEAVVLSKHVDRIDVVIAETLRCSLTPARSQRAYVGQLRGREVIYERSVAEVRADLAKQDPHRRRFR